MVVGIDIEQFVRDPYGSGIQRVLQYLAKEWPTDVVAADFVVPVNGGHGLLTPEQAAHVLSVPFAPREPEDDLRDLVRDAITSLDPVRVRPGDLLSVHDAWLLPEVSYLPSVLERLDLFRRCAPTAMIGYDTLPMSEPANYRFAPGSAAGVSEYFRQLAQVDAVVAISGYAREAILTRLRRDPAKATLVAHPGGDHVPIQPPQAPEAPGRPRFLRLGTLEARKRPREILGAFRRAVGEGLAAELVFVGGPSASDEGINAEVRRASAERIGVRWVWGADDAEVVSLMRGSSVFLSIGVEGYGIPVLEAIRLGTPVLYAGIQPAAELMEGRGARRIDGMTEEGLAAALHAAASDPSLRESLRPDAVPTWADFARTVARSVAP